MIRKLIFLLLPIIGYSQNPLILNGSGILEHGTQFSVTGEQFKLKVNASPYKYDNFDAGSNGEDIGNKWFVMSTKGMNPSYSNSVLRDSKNNQLSAYINHTNGNYNCTLGLVNENFHKFYLSAYYYITTSGAPSRNFKFLAFRSGGPGDTGEPEIRWDQYPVSHSGHMYLADCDNKAIEQTWNLGGDLHENGWHRVEVWMDQGDVNVSNGTLTTWRDNQLWCSINNVRIRTTNCTTGYSNFYLGHYFASDQGSPLPEMQLYWDDVYIDTTRARVEIGDNINFNQCTHREIQIPQSWSDNQIEFTVNLGTFTAGDSAYIFVVDKDGNASNGYGVVIGVQNPPSKVPKPVISPK